MLLAGACSGLPAGSPAVAASSLLQPAFAQPPHQPTTTTDLALCDDAGSPAGSLFRLKVVNLPPGLPYRDFVALFAACGHVFEARVVRDKASGQPVGYGYVSFGRKEDADRAVSLLDGQLQLEGAAGRLGVYYAKRQHGLKESTPARHAKLYFSGAPRGCKRETIVQMFSRYGCVRHLQVYSDSLGNLSSGTVTMFTADEAMAAMAGLDGQVLVKGAPPLKVTWAQLATTKPNGTASSNPSSSSKQTGFTLLYGNIPPTVAPADLLPTFEAFGAVLQVVPFVQRREGPANCRGHGLVVMAAKEAAASAAAALHGRLTWPGAERPMAITHYGTSSSSSSSSAAAAAADNTSKGAAAAAAALAGAPHHRAAAGGFGRASNALGGQSNHHRHHHPKPPAAPPAAADDFRAHGGGGSGSGSALDLLLGGVPADWGEQRLLQQLLQQQHPLGAAPNDAGAPPLVGGAHAAAAGYASGSAYGLLLAAQPQLSALHQQQLDAAPLPGPDQFGPPTSSSSSLDGLAAQLGALWGQLHSAAPPELPTPGAAGVRHLRLPAGLELLLQRQSAAWTMPPASVSSVVLPTPTAQQQQQQQQQQLMYPMPGMLCDMDAAAAAADGGGGGGVDPALLAFAPASAAAAPPACAGASGAAEAGGGARQATLGAPAAGGGALPPHVYGGW